MTRTKTRNKVAAALLIVLAACVVEAVTWDNLGECQDQYDNLWDEWSNLSEEYDDLGDTYGECVGSIEKYMYSVPCKGDLDDQTECMHELDECLEVAGDEDEARSCVNNYDRCDDEIDDLDDCLVDGIDYSDYCNISKIGYEYVECLDDLGDCLKNSDTSSERRECRDDYDSCDDEREDYDDCLVDAVDSGDELCDELNDNYLVCWDNYTTSRGVADVCEDEKKTCTDALNVLKDTKSTAEVKVANCEADKKVCDEKKFDLVDNNNKLTDENTLLETQLQGNKSWCELEKEGLASDRDAEKDKKLEYKSLYNETLKDYNFYVGRQDYLCRFSVDRTNEYYQAYKKLRPTAKTCLENIVKQEQVYFFSKTRPQQQLPAVCNDFSIDLIDSFYILKEYIQQGFAESDCRDANIPEEIRAQLEDYDVELQKMALCKIKPVDIDSGCIKQFAKMEELESAADCDLAAGASVSYNCVVPNVTQSFENEACVEGKRDGVTVGDCDPSTVEIPPQGGQGCTPGYWKQSQHFDSWVTYDPSDDYETVFGVDASFDKTLLGALQQGGGGEKALGRHAVAALLNTSNPDVSYAFSTAGVINIVQNAYATGNFNGAKNMLEFENEQGCPLN